MPSQTKLSKSHRDDRPPRANSDLHQKYRANGGVLLQAFWFSVSRTEGDSILELKPPVSGASILLHPASTKQKEGQALVKLVFDVGNVTAFCEAASGAGLKFGKIHQADGYVFANAKDPSGNSVQVSSRAFAQG